MIQTISHIGPDVGTFNPYGHIKGLSSIEPDQAGGQVDGGEEIAGGLVVADGDGAELLEPGEEVIDQMPRLEELTVMVAGRLAALFRRDLPGLAGRLQLNAAATREIRLSSFDEPIDGRSTARLTEGSQRPRFRAYADSGETSRSRQTLKLHVLDWPHEAQG